MKIRIAITVALLALWISPLPANGAAMNDGASGPEPLGWRSGEESIIQMKSGSSRPSSGPPLWYRTEDRSG